MLRVRPTRTAFRERHSLFAAAPLVALALATSSARAGTIPSTYTVTDLGALPGDTTSMAYGINNAGDVVGVSIGDAGANDHAFLYDAQGLHDLGRGWAQAINSSNQVVGTNDFGAGTHAALYTPGGGVKDLGTFGGRYSGASGINDAGQIVGAADIATAYAEHAFVYSNGVMQDLGIPSYTSNAFAINTHGQIAGEATPQGSTNSQAFIDSGGQIQSIAVPGAVSITPNGINNSGEVVGDYLLPNSPTFHPFIYSNGTAQELSINGRALGVNDSDDVVGSAAFGFLDQNGTVYDLNRLAVNSPGFITQATAINADGQIAASILVGNQTHAALLTPTGIAIPLPSAAWMGLGMIGLLVGGLACRRRLAGT